MGFFEVSDQGTLFLDEIADMPFNLQAKILRATEEKVVTRVGDTNPVHTDFRIVSATNLNIENRVEKKQFRLDLLHRLNTLHIHIPALRERPGDIKPLLIYFVETFAVRFNKPPFKIKSELFEALKKYAFPGNVRELKNLVERAIILSKGNTLGVVDFQVKVPRAKKSSSDSETLNLKIIEIVNIRKALKNTAYNQKAASDMLGISRDALIRKMKKYDISISKTEE
jgi:DNA-binding NtrC family response regulator